MTIGTITAPVEQAVLTDGVMFTVLVTSPEDASVNLYKDGVLLGAMTSLGGGDFDYDWTPGATASLVELHAVGNVTGSTEVRNVTVDDANLIDTDLTTWTKSNAGITITGSQTDPWGGSTAYRVALPVTTSTSRNIKYTVTTPPETLCGIDVWVKPYGGMEKMYVSSTGSAKGNYIDVSNGYSKSTGLYASIIEEGPNADGWVRIRFARAAETYDTTEFAFYFAQEDDSIVLNIDSTQAAAGIGLYFCEPRFISAVVPYMTDLQKLAVRLDSITDTVEKWIYKHPTVSAPIDMVTISDQLGYSGGNCFRVIRPDTWTDTGNYRVIYALPALVDVTEIAQTPTQDTPWMAMLDLDVANEYNVVIVVPYGKNSALWYGSFTDGSQDWHTFCATVMREFAIDRLGVSPDPRYHLLLGYSKSAAWGAHGLLIRNPDKFGAAVGWDGDYLHDFPQFDSGYQFDSVAQMRAYNPYYIAAAAKSDFNTTTRLGVMGGTAWNLHLTAYRAMLDSEGINYKYLFALETVHKWNTATWVPNAVSMLMDLANTNGIDDRFDIY